jgi:hypothetical protein
VIDGQAIPVRSHPALPFWCFGCPRCDADRYRMHLVGGFWACRECHGLLYRSQCRSRSVPGLHRLVWLRKRAGASLQPFSALPRKPINAKRHWRLVREIRELEKRLLAHGETIATVLEKRHERRKTVVHALVDGATIVEAQRRLGREVKSILDDETKRYYDATAIRERWMLAERTLLKVELLFYDEAVKTKDTAAAMVFVKTTLAGANAPIGHVISITNAAPLVQESSTEYYCRMLDLLDAESSPPMASEDDELGEPN